MTPKVVPGSARAAGLRAGLALVAGLVVFLTVNKGGVQWLLGSDFSSNAFYDGWAACLTLAVPAFLGGVALGFVASAQRVLLAFAGFGAFALVAPLYPSRFHTWQIPPVSPQSAHSGGMHYFLHSPLCLLTFALLGAWLAEQFALGRFTLADKSPVLPSQMGDD